MNNEFNNNLGSQESNNDSNRNEQSTQNMNANLGNQMPNSSQVINEQPNPNEQFSSNLNQPFENRMADRVQNNNMSETYQNNTTGNTMNGSNPSMPIYQNQPYMNNSGNKKNHIAIIMIIMVLFIVALVIVGAILIFSKDSSKKESNNKPTNEYEENNNSSNNSGTNSTSNSITYSGFQFTKVPGYVYEEDEGFLAIYNNDYYFTIETVANTFATVKAKYREYAAALELEGFTVGTPAIKTYSGVELFTIRISQDDMNAIYYMIPSPNDNCVFVGYVMNRNLIPYESSDLKEVLSFTKSAKYVGNYSNYSKDFNFKLDMKNIEN